jgi:hypothetical protein
MISVTHDVLVLEDQQIPPNHRFAQSRLGLRIELAAENSFLAGSRYFCESLFWASQPKQAAKT